MAQEEAVEGRRNGVVAGERPDPEVVPKARRRRFSAEYKLAVLREADVATEPGEIGALLRREGLFSSHLADWRRLREAGQLAGLAPKPRGRKPSAAQRQAAELARLQRENARLTERLRQAELIIDAQKKLGELLSQSATMALPAAGEWS
jgi:transposase-like protein